MVAYAQAAPAPAQELHARMSMARERTAGALREPGPWIGTGVALLAAIVVAHHPIARLIGTERSLTDTTTGPAVPASPGASGGATDLPQQILKALPAHAPVDPFHPLVTGQGALAARPVISLPSHPTAPAQATRRAPAHRTRAASGSRIAGSHAHSSGPRTVTYRVKSGDTLTEIAARLSHQTGGQSWLRWYDANRSVIGSNPDLIRAGMTLRVPKG